MRAGKLDQAIQIIRPGSWIDDGYGNVIPGPDTVLAALRAQVIQASTEEFIRAWGVSSETVVIYRTRHVDGVTLADKVRSGGQDHNILEIKPIGRRRGLELRCKRTGP